MLLRPFLTLVRGRLIFVFLFTMFIVMVVFSNSSAESPTDLTIFWHKFCGCPPDPRDVLFFLYSFSVIACYTGGILGFITGLRLGVSTSGSGSNPVATGDTRLLLTRPIPRRTVILNPFVIATAAGAWWSVIGPALMSVLLLRVSGVTLLEKDIGERRPQYADYCRRTNAFFPGVPKR